MPGYNFVSTGDAEKDAKISDDFERHDRLLAEGLCPNGHGAMEQTSKTDWECPACGFVYQTFALGAG